MVDDVVALYVTPAFGAIGAFYLSFDQVTDDEVIELMKRAPVVQPRG
jgi:predicted phosphoribosyltransferase